MRVLLFLNELSCSNNAEEPIVDEAMRHLVDVVHDVRRKRRETALVTPAPLKDMELAPGYHVRQWINKRENRDRWRVIQQARSISPVSSVLPQGGTSGVEYTHLGRPAEGLGGAHLRDGLAVSLPLEPEWQASWVTIDRRQPVEDNDGDIRLEDDKVEVRHASHHDETQVHYDWIMSSGLSGLSSGNDLWNAAEDFFPHLRFLPRVEQQLADLRADWLRPVRERLTELERTAAEWDPSRSPEPRWRSHVTPESTTRKSLCRFEDFDGAIRTFDMHARFTPGHGRLHFRLVPEAQQFRIAHIGRKLGIG